MVGEEIESHEIDIVERNAEIEIMLSNSFF